MFNKILHQSESAYDQVPYTAMHRALCDVSKTHVSAPLYIENSEIDWVSLESIDTHKFLIVDIYRHRFCLIDLCLYVQIICQAPMHTET